MRREASASPWITIGILNYNYERYLPAAIDSALAQTYRQIEVIVVDDGSSDGSADIVRAYGDEVIPVLKSNGGQASAMNAVFEMARGDVVIFLDADDLLHPDAASHVASAFKQGSGTAWLMFRLRMIDADGSPMGRVRPRRQGVMPNGDLREHLVKYRCFHWQPTSGNAFAGTALDQVMPIPEDDYRISADAYLAGVVPMCGPVRSTDAVLGSYRLHGGSNYSSQAVDVRYFHDQIERQLITHQHAVAVGADVGVDLPADPRAPRDAAFLGFRLASLVLAPEDHPLPGDRRISLTFQGIVAALWNPRLSWLTRLRRSAWFLGAGVLPRPLAARVGARSPDTPAARNRQNDV